MRRVNFWEFTDFRHLLVHKYRKTYNMLLTQLMAGPVLHVDETEIKLKDGGGYVWVFASTSATVYIFRRSREGEFLWQMLKDFEGVLVSDFLFRVRRASLFAAALHYPPDARHEPDHSRQSVRSGDSIHYGAVRRPFAINRHDH
jgi:hypothetical protein